MSNTASIWRSIGLGGLLLVLGSVGWNVYSRFSAPATVLADDNAYVDITVPKSHYKPSEVVVLQIQAMRDAIATPEQMIVCYSLASPQNRKETGPFARFAQMVMLPPYDRLAICPEWRVLGTSIEKEFAAVWVSTATKEGETLAFQFVLQQYKDEPYAGCWLTEAVQIIDPEELPTGILEEPPTASDVPENEPTGNEQPADSDGQTPP